MNLQSSPSLRGRTAPDDFGVGAVARHVIDEIGRGAEGIQEDVRFRMSEAIIEEELLAGGFRRGAVAVVIPVARPDQDGLVRMGVDDLLEVVHVQLPPMRNVDQRHRTDEMSLGDGTGGEGSPSRVRDRTRSRIDVVHALTVLLEPAHVPKYRRVAMTEGAARVPDGLQFRRGLGEEGALYLAPFLRFGPQGHDVVDQKVVYLRGQFGTQSIVVPVHERQYRIDRFIGPLVIFRSRVVLLAVLLGPFAAVVHKDFHPRGYGLRRADRHVVIVRMGPPAGMIPSVPRGVRALGVPFGDALVTRPLIPIGVDYSRMEIAQHAYSRYRRVGMSSASMSAIPRLRPKLGRVVHGAGRIGRPELRHGEMKIIHVFGLDEDGGGTMMAVFAFRRLHFVLVLVPTRLRGGQDRTSRVSLHVVHLHGDLGMADDFVGGILPSGVQSQFGGDGDMISSCRAAVVVVLVDGVGRGGGEVQSALSASSACAGWRGVIALGVDRGRCDQRGE
mmetsp:Transcript_19195/g.55877  ORF Transcript_19195/g.55877 Transcript_19195/m.55877 type:complete len:500 (+) Transcript_19195:433-1932(+)